MVMIRTDIELNQVTGSQRVVMRVSPAGKEERSRNLLNREAARQELSAIGVLPADIDGTFQIIGNEPGIWVSVGQKDLDEEQLKANGWL